MTPVSLSILSTGRGNCALSGALDQRGANVRFEDGTLEGFVCWEALERLLKLKGESATKKR